MNEQVTLEKWLEEQERQAVIDRDLEDTTELLFKVGKCIQIIRRQQAALKEIARTLNEDAMGDCTAYDGATEAIADCDAIVGAK